MLKAAAQLDGVVAVCSGGVEFAQDTARSYDRALIKEVVHHIPDEALAAMYAGIFAQLSPGGVCLTATRPCVVQYPFFDAAMQVWKQQ